MEERRIGNIYGFDGGNYAGNVYDKKGLCPTIRTFQGNQQPMIVEICGRNPDNPTDRDKSSTPEIRKITPLESWRMMGFSDEDFRKAEDVNSNSQLYKQAGNSIVKNVLVAIFGQMIPGKENIYKGAQEGTYGQQ